MLKASTDIGREREMSRSTLTNVRCQALFVSPVQPSEHADSARARAAIQQAIQQYGSRGCAARVAQEFGDHPDTAPARMRWARSLVATAFVAAEPVRARLGFPCRASGLPAAA
jgi:hypothetical protein